MTRTWRLVVGLVVLGGTAASAAAQDAIFQQFFRDVCNGTGTAGALATRCAEGTEMGTGVGELSEDSENSLNPSQIVTSNESAILRARAQERRVRDRLERRRLEGAPEEDEVASVSRQVVAGMDGPQGALAYRSSRGDDAAEAGLAGGRLSVFLNARGSWFDRDATAEERGIDGSIYSGQLGVDYRVTDALVLGTLFDYSRTDSEFDADAPGVGFVPFSEEGRIDSDAYTFTWFGSYSFSDALYFDAHGSYGFANYEFERSVVFQNADRTTTTNVLTRAAPDGEVWSVGTGIGYDFREGAMSLTPYARWSYTRTEIEGFSERDLNGSGLAMTMDQQVRKSLVSVVGARWSLAVSTPFGVVLPQLRAEYEHEFERDAQSALTSYRLDAANTFFPVSGDDPDRNYFNLGGGVVVVLPGGWIGFADYEGLFDYRDLNRHTATIGVRAEF